MVENIPCNLDPRKDCPKSCPLYIFAENLLSRNSSSGRDRQEIINSFRNSSNADILASYREGQSETLRKFGLIESCYYYPESDITLHPEI